jgi:hypothetical protein
VMDTVTRAALTRDVFLQNVTFSPQLKSCYAGLTSKARNQTRACRRVDRALLSPPRSCYANDSRTAPPNQKACHSMCRLVLSFGQPHLHLNGLVVSTFEARR